MKCLCLYIILIFCIQFCFPSKVLSQQNITKIEYFIDNDPGIGNANTINFIPSPDVADLNFGVDVGSLNEGVHCLYVRTQDANGNWSLVNRLLFYKPYSSALPLSPVNIATIEYYFDTDPGLGNGTNLSITPDTNLSNVILPINTERLSPCSHTLYIRAKDANGNWSLVNSYSFVNTYLSPTATPQDFMVRFDGQNDYLDLGTWFNQQKFTLSFWVKPDSVQINGAAIAAIQNDLYLYANPNAQHNYVLAHLLQFDLLPNQWNHVTITADAATNKRQVYLFGQLIDSNQWNYAPQSGFNLRFGNGGFFPNSYFKGALDEIKLWNRVLSPDSIYLNVSKPLNGNESGLLGYWNFNNGCDPTAPDLTVNNHVATLKNGLAKVPSSVLSIGQQIIPNKGGNSGAITVKIYDNLFQAGAKARLKKSGFADIIADTVVVSVNGTVATCKFNLSGRDTGLYNVIITNPDTTVKTYRNSFTIEGMDSTSNIDIQLLGRNVLRRGRIHKFLIVYENTGNVDVPAPWHIVHSYNKDFIAFSKENLEYRWQNLPVSLGNRPAYGRADDISYADTVLSPGVVYTIPVYVESVLDTSNANKLMSSMNVSSCEELHFYVVENPDVLVPIRPDGSRNYIDGCSNTLNMTDFNTLFVSSECTENWNTIFRPACEPHDYCYQSCNTRTTVNVNGFPITAYDWKSKEICDNKFHEDLLKICNSKSGRDREWCELAAKAYYRGVKYLGGEPYTTNQSYCKPRKDTLYYTVPIPNCPPKCPPGAKCKTDTDVNSFDPNEKIGPGNYQKTKDPFSYVVLFENKNTATAPAQEVVIIDTIDKSKFDISTFSFGDISFGDTSTQTTYQYSKQFVNHIDLRPSKNLILEVSGRADTASGVVFWKFKSLDPSTMLLTEDPYLGFLPPNVNSPEGEGWVSFTIKPYSTLPTGAELKNKAIIIFDVNAPIITNQAVTRIDNILPLSKVQALSSTQPDSNFVIRWKGSDSIAGVRYYSIYVSDNYAAFNLWRTNLSDTFVNYPGHRGHHYRFYSIATDSAGNMELQKTLSEAGTLVTMSISDSLCLGDDVYIASGKTAPGNAYKWQVDTGVGFQNMSSNGIYSQINSDTLKLTSPPSSYSGYLYRCIVSKATSSDTSSIHEIRFVNTWNGTVDTAWEVAGNWSCGVVPDEHTDVIIPTNTSRSPVINSNASCKLLNLSQGASLNIKSGYNLFVSGKGFR